jgi:hypothetical protein
MRTLSLLLAVLFGSALNAQQVPDSAFAFPNPNPAFSPGTGPEVCVDAAHFNFHTLDGRYFTFGKLLRGDGFRTVSVTQPFDTYPLSDCDVLVVANALAAENAYVEGDPDEAETTWDPPNPPAFGVWEVKALLRWVQEGGNLLLIMDHAPFPGAASDLASLLGVVPLNGAAVYRIFGELDEGAIQEAAGLSGLTPESMREALGAVGALGEHPILKGRDGMDETVRSLMTFGGSAFFPSAEVQPLLRVPPGAVGSVPSQEVAQELWPTYSMDGWLVGGAKPYGEGRVVILGEAAMCSAQLAGPDRGPMGMNHPLSVDNPRFCLNVVRWLAGVL